MSERARVLTSLAPQLTGERMKQVLIAALAAAQDMKDEGIRARVLTSLAPQLTGERKEQVLEAALAAARGIKDEGIRARVVTSLHPAHRRAEGASPGRCAGRSAGHQR